MILGITGTTGSGKTTLLGEIKKNGGYVIDCDAVYHELLQTNMEMLKALDHCFSGVVVGGVLQRKKLGALVFDNPQALEKLNHIIYPYVQAEVERRLQLFQDSSLIGIDAISLFESGLSLLCHHVVAVTAPKEVRIARLITRDNISDQYANLRVKAQRDDEIFCQKSDVVLSNDFPSVEEFQKHCSEFLRKLGGIDFE